MDYDYKYDYKIIKSNRKTLEIQVKKDLVVVFRAPKHMSDREILKFAKQKEAWIQKHLELMKRRNESNRASDEASEPENKYTPEELENMKRYIKNLINERAASFAAVMGVSFGKITVRSQKTRWGSCSSAGNLNFNCLLALCPSEVIDYVVVHELCHLRHMNHSRAFWNEVAKYFPGYAEQKDWLKRHQSEIMRKLG